MTFQFCQSYPFKAPDVRFVTPIYHCNVNTSGKVWWSASVVFAQTSKICDCRPVFRSSAAIGHPQSLPLTRCEVSLI